MKEKITYIADDGQEFRDINDCNKYEMCLFSLLLEKSNIIAYDKNMNIINLQKSQLKGIYCINLKTRTAAIAFRNYCDMLGIYSPFEWFECKEGIYLYDTYRGWCDLDEELQKLYKLKDIIENSNKSF